MRGNKKLKLCILAAIIIVALVYAIASSSGTKTEWNNLVYKGYMNPESSSNQIETVAKLFNRRDFKGDVLEVETFIRKQIEAYTPISSQLPTYWTKGYQSFEEVADYLGLKQLKNPKWHMEEQDVTLSIQGNKQGHFELIGIETYYKETDVRMQSFVYILTEYSKDIAMSFDEISSREDVSSIYVNKNGNECRIVSSITDSNSYYWHDGYVVSDGILYSAHVVYVDGQKEQAMELLEEWLDRY